MPASGWPVLSPVAFQSCHPTLLSVPSAPSPVLQMAALACRLGKLSVIKLLAPRMERSNPVDWLPGVIESLEVAEEGATPTIVSLTSVASYIHNLDPASAVAAVVCLAERYPHATLHLLNEFHHQGTCPEHFVRTGFSMVGLPREWVNGCTFTHVDVSNNLLSDVPPELFQLTSLRVLNLSTNCLEMVPSILIWNCPALRDLDLSHNCLKAVRWGGPCLVARLVA